MDVDRSLAVAKDIHLFTLLFPGIDQRYENVAALGPLNSYMLFNNAGSSATDLIT